MAQSGQEVVHRGVCCSLYPLPNLIQPRLEERAVVPTVASHRTKPEGAPSLPITWGVDKPQEQHEAVCLLSAW